MYDIKCSHCGHEQEINHDDGHGYSDGEAHNQTCNGCSVQFYYETITTFTYINVSKECNELTTCDACNNFFDDDNEGSSGADNDICGKCLEASNALEFVV